VVASVKDPTVRVGLDPSKYEAGAERLSLAQQRIVRAQEAAERKQRAMASQEFAAYREQDARVAAAAAAVEKAEKAKQDAFRKTGTVVTASSAVLLAGLGYAAHAAISWESAWASVTKTVDATPAELASVEAGLRGLARTLPLTHEEIAQVAASAGQLGVAVPQITSFTKTMIDLGTTTNLTADDAATKIAQLANVMDRSMLQAGDGVQRTGATLLALGNAGASTESDILDMATRISGAGKTAGLTTADVLALSSSLASMGVEAELGGGTVTRILTKIYSAVRSGDPVLGEFAKTAGMTLGQFRTLWDQSPVEALDKFTTGLHNLDAAGGDVVATLRAVGIDQSRDTQVLLQMSNATGLLSDNLTLANQAWKDNTALVDAANKRYDTTAAKVQIAKNNIEDAGISLGNELLPVLSKVATGVADAAAWIGDLPEPVLKAATALGGAAAAAGLLTGAALILVPRIAETIRIFKELRTLSPSVASGLGKTATALGKAGAAVAAVGVVGALIDPANRDADQRSVTQYTKMLLDLQNAAKPHSGTIVEDLAEAYKQLEDPSTSFKVNDWFSNVAKLWGDDSNSGRLKDNFRGIGQALASMYDSSPDLAAEKFNEIQRVTGATTDKLLDLLPDYRDRLQDASNAQATGAGTADDLTQHLNMATGAVEQLTDAEQQYRDEIAQSDAAMVSLSQAYDDSVQARKDHAQAQADAANKAADAEEAAAKKQHKTLDIADKDWTDYYDGKTVKVDAYLATLQKQVDQQSKWERNLLTLGSRGVSSDTIDALRQMGTGGAPLVDQLAHASDGQLKKLDKLYSQAGSTATGTFADELATGTPVLQAAGDKLGQATVDAIIAKLVAGKTDLQQIIDDYGLVVAGFKVPDSLLDPGQSTSDRLNATGKAQAKAAAANAGRADSSARLDAIGAAQAARALPATGGSAASVIVVPMSSKTEIPVTQTFSGPVTFTDPKSASKFGKTRALNTLGG